MTRIRLNLEFPPEVHEQMLEVQARTHAASITEVLRRAIALYDYVTEIQGRGARLMIAEDGAEPANIRIL